MPAKKAPAKKTEEKKSEPATKTVTKEVPVVAPVHVDDSTARSDEDARVGQFAKVISGEHAGRYGVLDTVATYNTENGYPDSVVLVTRDAASENLVVNYADLRPAVAGGRV